MFVSDWIGDDYKSWAYEKIFITAPTGSGKTTFCLRTLLKYYHDNGKRILYLVNRNILKEQLQSDVRSIYAGDLSVQNAIEFATYQEIENDILNASRQGTRMGQYSHLTELSQYSCVICDEAHYFLSDSNFNSNTILSLDWILETFDSKLMIFMSATVDRLHDYIRDYEYKKRDECSETYRLPMYYANHKDYQLINNLTGDDDLDASGKIIRRRNYDIETPEMHDSQNDICQQLDNRKNTYEYLDIGILNDEDDILRLVEDTKQKWLIFVNSIDQGNELKRRIDTRINIRRGRRSDGDSDKSDIRPEVVMLTAEYAETEDSLLEVSDIAKRNKYEARILISTSVMDNGITLHDIELRNLIISADVETQFIQMLGRKRRDDQKVKLYLFRRDKSFFNRRLQNFQRLSNIARFYLKDLDEKVQLPWRQIGNAIGDKVSVDQLIGVFYLMYISDLGKIVSESELYLWPVERKASFFIDLLDVVQSLKSNRIVADPNTITDHIQKIGHYSQKQRQYICNNVYTTINRAREYIRLYNVDSELSPELENAFDTILLIDENIFNLEFVDEKAAAERYSNHQEQDVIRRHHIQLLQDVFSHKIEFEDVSSMFFAYLGILYMNPLSVRNLEYLCGYYQEVLEEYDRRNNDRDSFVRRQLSWLGKSDEEIEEIIRRAEWTEANAYIESVRNAIEGNFVDNDGKPVPSVIGVPMTREEHIKFRDKYIRSDILKLLKLDERNEDPEYGKALRAFYKTKTPISKQSMDYLRENYDLPYRMEVSQNTYTIEKIENDN